MKNIYTQSLVFVAICIMGFSHIPPSVSTYKINNSKDNSMKLSGTSTLHKWAMNTGTFTGEAQFGFTSDSDTKLNSVNALNFSLAVLSLKSNKKGLDKNAYSALKTDQFKNIVYKLTSATVSPEKERKYLIKTIGNLSIAGVTKEVAMDVYCVVNKDATITCSGSDKLNMSDYNVKPPSFMMGAMKTGDAITIEFTLVYKK